MSHSPGRTLVTIIALLAAACNGSERTSEADRAPSLQYLDSLVLVESDSIYLGRPDVSFVVGPDGHFYIPDEFWSRVAEYDRSGRLVRTIGKAGEGPGEFGSTTPGTLVLDSFIVQPSFRSLHVFERASGKFRFRVPVVGYISRSIATDSLLAFAAIDPVTRNGLLLMPRHQFFALENSAPAAPLQSTRASWPSEYKEFPALTVFYSTNVVARDSTFLLGYSGVPYLVDYDLAGASTDTFWIPWRRRTGSPPERYEPLKDPELPMPERAQAVSSLSGMWIGDSGRIVTLHRDNRVIPFGNTIRMLARAWISVVSADLDSACVDAELQFPGSDWPRVTVRGDTVFALDQSESATDSLRSVTVVRRYLLDLSSCDWLPTARPG